MSGAQRSARVEADDEARVGVGFEQLALAHLLGGITHRGEIQLHIGAGELGRAFDHAPHLVHAQAQGAGAQQHIAQARRQAARPGAQHPVQGGLGGTVGVVDAQMVLQAGAHEGVVMHHWQAVLFEQGCWPNARELQQLG